MKLEDIIRKLLIDWFKQDGIIYKEPLSLSQLVAIAIKQNSWELTFVFKTAISAFENQPK